jgi:probable F420-dependent oxidoreductase
MVAHGAASQLGQAFPGRVVLGIGAGYPSQAARVGNDYSKPLAQLRTYVSRLTEASPPLETPAVNYPTILAAMGRGAIALGGEVADGTMTVTVPPFYVSEIRSIVGPDKLIVVGLNIYVDDDGHAARATAAAALAGLAGFPGSPYGRALRAMGYSDDELASGADRVLRDLCAFGSVDAVALAARRLLDAGADHVVLYTTPRDFASGVDVLEAVAPAVVEPG